MINSYEISHKNVRKNGVFYKHFKNKKDIKDYLISKFVQEGEQMINEQQPKFFNSWLVENIDKILEGEGE